jgi:hypothetical protein
MGARSGRSELLIAAPTIAAKTVRSDRDTSASGWVCCFFCDIDLEQSPACVTEDDDAGKTSYSIG